VDFIQKFIFPGGMLPCPARPARRGRAGRAHGRAVGRIRGELQPDAAALAQTFNERWDEIALQGFDDRFRRMWNFYLTSCAATFESGNCDVTQITVTRPA
jgi:cyclopropane-fatty-acyl-phospholipid synthase